jgi:hypothetical protein
MLKKIEALRKQPVEVRNRYAFWIATVVTLIIAVVWASTFPARFSQEAPATVEESPSSVGALDSIKAFVASMSERFGPVIATPNEATTTEERVDLVELLKNATTTPQDPLPPSHMGSTSTTTNGEFSTTSTTTSSTSQSN